MDRYEYFRLFHDISVEDYNLMTRRLKNKRFRKGQVLVVPGEVQRVLYFVKKGVQMSYVETESKTHVIAFTYYPNLCAIPGSFSLQQPSTYFLTCLSESEMEYLTYADLQQIFDDSPPVERLFRKMTEWILSGMIERHIEIHTLTMEERYKAFCNRSPHLLQQVPHKYIASYLGIDPTNFSKLYNSVRL